MYVNRVTSKFSKFYQYLQSIFSKNTDKSVYLEVLLRGQLKFTTVTLAKPTRRPTHRLPQHQLSFFVRHHLLVLHVETSVHEVSSPNAYIMCMCGTHDNNVEVHKVLSLAALSPKYK